MVSADSMSVHPHAIFMTSPPHPANEILRLRQLRALDILDTAPEECFDRITRLASQLLDTPIALVSLVDASRQWFKSRVGLDARETPREIAFCAHTILGHEPLVVNDVAHDARFQNNPLVTGELGIRFYAGMPLRCGEGGAMGTLCVIDQKPREFGQREIGILRDLAYMAERELAYRAAGAVTRELTAAQFSAIEQSETLFRSLFDLASVGFAMVGLDGRLLKINMAFADILKYTQEELQALTFQQITHPADLDLDLALVRQLLQGECHRYSLEKRYFTKDGESVWVDLNVTLVRENDAPKHFIAIVTNIDARKNAEASLNALRHQLEERVTERTCELQSSNDMLSVAMQQRLAADAALRVSEAEMRAVISNAQDAYLCIDEASVIVEWNQQAEALFGWTRDEAIGHRLDEMMIPPAMRAAHRSGMQRLLNSGQSKVLGQRIELPAMNRKGEMIPCEISINRLPTTRGVRFFAFLRDIRERKALERALEQQASEDPLTGLPNRRSLIAHLEEAASRTRRTRLPFSLHFVDLDGFKLINDTYGHDAGDTVLRELGSRFRHELRESDFVARLGGDEFVIVAEQFETGASDQAALARKIRQIASMPIAWKGASLQIDCSVGTHSFALDDLTDPARMIAMADSRMYSAKQSRKQGAAI